jgi:hypothetical protein
MKRTEKVSKTWKAFANLPEVTTIEVGVFQAEGAEKHSTNGKQTVADIAAIHEFGALITTGEGLTVIPARSFIRAWFDENEDKIQAYFAQRLDKLGPERWTQALEQTALWIQSQIQRRIRKGIPPKLAQSTIDRKKSSKPLIDTGQLLAAILAKVDGKQPS